jgi:molecular chaperone GrpE
MKVDVTTPEEEQPQTPAETDFEMVDVDVQDDAAETAAVDDEVFSMADIENARAEAKAANERYMRLQAEWDNFRKRTAREREEERVRASEALVTKLLPVVDDLERSLDHAAKSAPEGEFGEFVVGVRAVYDKLVDVFDKTGVEAIDPAGTPFDMNEHQAVAHIDDPSLPDGTVRDVYQKGYRMGGRVIRPAMVTVSKGGPAREAEAAEE